MEILVERPVALEPTVVREANRLDHAEVVYYLATREPNEVCDDLGHPEARHRPDGASVRKRLAKGHRPNHKRVAHQLTPNEV